MKRQRQQMLLEIIKDRAIETQEELREALRERGYPSTQATISRDMKELSLVKKVEDGVQRYGVATVEQTTTGNPSLSHIMKEGVVSVAVAQNIVVVKTIAGLAMAVCTALDNMDISGNVGTLAGDDTCILIMKDNKTAQNFSQEMGDFLEEKSKT